MGYQSCAASGCRNNGANVKGKIPKITFYRFPSGKQQRSVWIRFTKHKKNPDGTDWQPTDHSRLCSAHFLGFSRHYSPLSPSYNPTIHAGQSPPEDAEEQLKRFERMIERRTKEVMGDTIERPVIMLDHDYISNGTKLLPVITKERECQTTFADRRFKAFTGKLLHFSSTTNCTSSSNNLNENGMNTVLTLVRHDVATQVEHESEELAVKMKDASMQTYAYKPFKDIGFPGYEKCVGLNQLHMITAVRPTVFNQLLNLLGDFHPRIVRREDILLISLFKLRFHIPFSTLSALFSIASGTIENNYKKIVTLLSGRHENYRKLVKDLRVGLEKEEDDDDDEVIEV